MIRDENWRTASFQRNKTQDRIIHIIIPRHKINVVPRAGFQGGTHLLFVIGDIVVERQGIVRFKILINTIPLTSLPRACPVNIRLRARASHRIYDRKGLRRLSRVPCDGVRRV